VAARREPSLAPFRWSLGWPLGLGDDSLVVTTGLRGVEVGDGGKRGNRGRLEEADLNVDLKIYQEIE
jgi:hypothetical protein